MAFITLKTPEQALRGLLLVDPAKLPDAPKPKKRKVKAKK